MFGKMKREIVGLKAELESAKDSIVKLSIDREQKLMESGKSLDAYKEENARLSETIATQAAEIARLGELLQHTEDARRAADQARNSDLKNERALCTTAQSALFAARHGEDPETDAFYSARFAASKAKPESNVGEAEAAPAKEAGKGKKRRK